MTLKPIGISVAALSWLALSASPPTLAGDAAGNPLHLAPASTVTLVVADLDKEIAWWQDVLGFRETTHHKAPTGAVRTDEMRRVELGGYRVDLVWHKGSTRPPPPARFQEGYSHISFTVDSSVMVKDYEWLVAHGVTIDASRDKTTNALQIMRFKDPEGNEIHIEIPN
jgi:catechol 2,3-dioxygenase-like lactoylglutathione lyase family enzyme